MAGNGWPDQVKAPERNQNAPPEVQIEEARKEIRAEFEKWLASIGGEVGSEEQNEKAKSFAARVAELGKEGEQARSAQKEPHLKAGRQIDGMWKPIIAACDVDRRFFAKACEEFRKKRVAEKQIEVAKRVLAGEFVHPVEAKPRGGTGLRTVHRAEITDIDAFWGYVKGWPDVTGFLQDVANRLARNDATRSMDVPGIKMISESKAV
jgi:hypothetical protein